ncbi:MAG: glycosyltransferase family 2 protein [Candidatus Odinarchaeia archaeon]
MVDVVIPTKNSGSTLDYCIRSVKATIPNLNRIIVVDNFSVDNTKEIAVKHGCVFIESSARYSLALREGAKMAKGKYFMIVDSDVVLRRNIHILFNHVDSGYGVIKGVCRQLFHPKFDALADYLVDLMRQRITGLEAALLNRDLFLEFTEDWEHNDMDAGGDLNLFYRFKQHGVPMLNLPLVVSLHITGDWKRVWRQAIWYGKSFRKRAYLPIYTTNRSPVKSFLKALDAGLKYKSLKLFAAVLGNTLCIAIGRALG